MEIEQEVEETTWIFNSFRVYFYTS